MSLSKRACAVVLMLPFVFVSAGSAASKQANVKIVNKSDWRIEELYFSPVNNEAWGPDQLQKHVIEPGAEFTLTSIPCDSWDVKLVDEDGDACVVEEVNICGQADTWTITSKDLLKCQANS